MKSKLSRYLLHYNMKSIKITQNVLLLHRNIYNKKSTIKMSIPESTTSNLLDFDLSEITSILNNLNSGADRSEVVSQLKSLQEKIAAAKQKIDRVDYIRTSKEYQQKHLDCLLKQLKIKEDVIGRYQNFFPNCWVLRDGMLF